MRREPVYLSVCAVYRNEAPYLREWIEFHRLVGVERFFLYNNRSEDDHSEALAPYQGDDTVVVRDWPDWPAQVQTYEDCLKRHRDESRWIAFLDLDEFLFSPTGSPLPELLADYERWPGVGVNWAVFGSSGHKSKPPGLVLENYVRRTERPGLNCHIKSIANPRLVRAFCSPHFFMYTQEPGVAVDENHRPIGGPRRSLTDEVSFSQLRVNHYTNKSEEEFRRKLERGPADSSKPRDERFTEEELDRFMRAWNDIEDRTIQMYLPDLRDRLARLDGAD